MVVVTTACLAALTACIPIQATVPPATAGSIVSEQVNLAQPVVFISTPAFTFAPAQTQLSQGYLGPQQTVLSDWSPDGRHLLFWTGPVGASVQADGLSLYVLDVATKQATLLADVALLNPHYHSWAADSSALAFTAGGYRSAQVNKWLDVYNVASGQVTTAISQSKQIPGMVAWSPRSDWIAYAAVLASATGPEWADWMTFSNPAIAGRRIYLLQPATGEQRRLNTIEAFQDAPLWNEDGSLLYYVQQAGSDVVLMAADPVTGEATVVEASRQPLPERAGFYGQGEWDILLNYRSRSSQQ